MKYSTFHTHLKHQNTNIILHTLTCLCLSGVIGLFQVASVQAAIRPPRDTRPPTVPGEVKASASSSSQIDLSWKASSDSSGVRGYKIYRSNTQIATVTTTSFSNTGLSANTTYQYAVAAYDRAGNTSSKSSLVSATTLANSTDSTPPTVPGGLTATAVSSSIINLTWTAATDSEGVTGYKVFRNGNEITTVSDTSFSDTGLAADTTYSYTVSAMDAAGNESEQSTAVSETTSAGSSGDTTPPTVPSDLTATAISFSAINLSWTAANDAVGVTGYHVFRDGTQVAIVTDTSFSDTGLTANTTYNYTVSAMDAAGNESGQSQSASATTQTGDGSGGGGGTDDSACNANMSNFKLSGDPASRGGATWTYVSTDGGISYNLKGILFKPSTGGSTFPGGIVSHGLGGTAPVEAAKLFQGWGMVAIGTNYTHSSDDAGGLPSGEEGASTANIQRAHKTWDILCGLGYVDMKRVVAHGHSMGAFVTAALVGSYPNDFKAASHTAGGVSDNKAPTWTSSTLANGIKVPYQMHHGDADAVVPLKDDQTLDSLLTSKGVTHELKVYAGYTHPDVRDNTTIMNTVKDWYTKYGVFSSTATTAAASSMTAATADTTATASGSNATTVSTTAGASDSLGITAADVKLNGAVATTGGTFTGTQTATGSAPALSSGAVTDNSLTAGNVYYVSAAGSDSNSGASTSQPLQTIAAALNSAASGDIIYVMGGTYAETISITQSGITLSAYGNETPVIDGNTALPGIDDGALLSVEGNDNTVSGFEIKNSNVNGEFLGGYGIRITGSNNKISNVNIHDTWGDGILMNGEHNVVEDSTTAGSLQ
jgi:chitodextrinase/dienelactone hydrolase